MVAEGESFLLINQTQTIKDRKSAASQVLPSSTAILSQDTWQHNSSGYLWMSVDNAGYAVVVDVGRCAEHGLGRDAALVLGLVSEHGTVNAIADGVNVGNNGLEPRKR